LVALLASLPRRKQTHRSRPSLAAGELLAGATTALSNTPNQPLVVPRPFPHPSPAKSRRTLPEFYSTAPASRAQDHIAKRRFFPRASLQKVKSNSKTLWLILVNCVENHRKIIKMLNQFCWICCELSYNFCYSGLSQFLLVFA
jgi:hypothetical protein